MRMEGAGGWWESPTKEGAGGESGFASVIVP